MLTIITIYYDSPLLFYSEKTVHYLFFFLLLLGIGIDILFIYQVLPFFKMKQQRPKNKNISKGKHYDLLDDDELEDITFKNSSTSSYEIHDEMSYQNYHHFHKLKKEGNSLLFL